MKIPTLICASLLALSCSQNKEEERQPAALSPLSSQEVLQTFHLYMKGDYDAYVGQMLSCDRQPESYREQMVILFRQHAADQRKDNGPVCSASVTSVTTDTASHTASALLRISYENGDCENIQLRFVHDGKSWRLR